MQILVVGSVALDTIRTPFGEAEEVLGGSATYFSLAASLFGQVGVVAVVGEDFPRRYIDLLSSRGVDLRGLQVVPGRTFRWKGYYDYDLNTAHTLETQLNVFQDFNPVIPDEYRDAEYVFLANIDPVLQRRVLEQVIGPKVVVCDTMNFWIENRRDELLETISRVDILVLNDSEARQLAGQPNLITAGRELLKLGPSRVVIKKGEHGVIMLSDGTFFSLPAYPCEEVFDPTGAGDSFGGGFVGYLAGSGDLGEESMRRAVVYGSVVASYTVEAFSCERLKGLTMEEVEQRFSHFMEMTCFSRG